MRLTLPALRDSESSLPTAAGAIVVPATEQPERVVEIDARFVEFLMVEARRVAASAYAPYSKFRVGAVVVMADCPDDRIFTGTNVENGSYGATVCAERSALSAAAGKGFRRLRCLAVSTLDSLDGPLRDRSPCGLCRQVIREFVPLEGGETPLVFIDSARPGVLCEVMDIERLLPHGFNFQGPGPAA